MSAPNPGPREVQVVAPQQEAQPATQPETPTQTPAEPQTPPEDRILSTSEVEQALRSMGQEDGGPESDDTREPDLALEATQSLFPPSDPSQSQAVQQARQEVDAGTGVQAQPQPQPQPTPQYPFQQPQPGTGQAPVPAQTQAPPPQVPEREQLLQTQVSQLQQQLAHLTQVMQQQQQGAQAQPQAQAPTQQQAQPTRQLYAGLQNINPQLTQLLGSEDPNQRHQAVVQLVSGLAETVHETVMQQVNQRIQSEVPTMIHGTVGKLTEEQRIEQDFYGTYPELRDMPQIVAATAQQVISERPYMGYTSEVRDEIARRLAPLRPTILQRLNGGQTQAPNGHMPGYGASQGYPARPPAGPPVQPQQMAQVVPNAAPGQPVQHQPGQVAPMLVRDAYGNYATYVQPPTYAPGPAAQPPQGGVPSEQQDIWGTLGY